MNVRRRSGMMGSLQTKGHMVKNTVTKMGTGNSPKAIKNAIAVQPSTSGTKIRGAVSWPNKH